MFLDGEINEKTLRNKEEKYAARFSFGQGALQHPNPILHALDEVLDFDLKGSQALGSFGQDFFHFSFPVKNRFHFSFVHLFFYFFLHFLQPDRPGCLRSQLFTSSISGPLKSADFTLLKKLQLRPSSLPIRIQLANFPFS